MAQLSPGRQPPTPAGGRPADQRIGCWKWSCRIYSQLDRPALFRRLRSVPFRKQRRHWAGDDVGATAAGCGRQSRQHDRHGRAQHTQGRTRRRNVGPRPSPQHQPMLGEGASCAERFSVLQFGQYLSVCSRASVLRRPGAPGGAVEVAGVATIGSDPSPSGTSTRPPAAWNCSSPSTSSIEFTGAQEQPPSKIISAHSASVCEDLVERGDQLAGVVGAVDAVVRLS